MKKRVLAWIDTDMDLRDETAAKLLLIRSLHQRPGGEPVNFCVQEHELPNSTRR